MFIYMFIYIYVCVYVYRYNLHEEQDEDLKFGENIGFAEEKNRKQRLSPLLILQKTQVETIGHAGKQNIAMKM